MATQSLQGREALDFKAAYCRRFKCPPRAFEQRLFWACIPPYARPLAWMIRLGRRDFFRWDLEYVRRIGRAHSVQDLQREIGALHAEARLLHGRLGRYFHVRILGRRLRRLADAVYQ